MKKEEEIAYLQDLQHRNITAEQRLAELYILTQMEL